MSQSDFLGSIAQEDVSFITQITKAVVRGDNYYKLMIFIEGLENVEGDGIASGRFILEPDIFQPIFTGSHIYIASVNKDDYAEYVEGLLKSWLDDYFASNHTQVAYLVVYGEEVDSGATAPEIAAAVAALEAAYNELKPIAYHKTVCAGGDTAILPQLAVKLAQLCSADHDLLSAAPYYPMTAADAASFATDPIYLALKTADPTFKTADAFMTAYNGISRNGSLYSLGLSLSMVNSTGTPVGNNIDYWATDGIGASGPDGRNLSKVVRNALKAANIAFFKPVGDGTGQNAAVGVKTLAGRYIQAMWIVNYIDFMCKVLVAAFITKPNTLRDASSYAGIINIMTAQINRFGNDGSGRLRNIVISAPSYLSLPPAAGDEIIIPKAWSAEYTDQVHTVQVYGNLIISE